jgi:hypothetical protein
VNIDDHRALAGKARRRAIEESGNCLSVEAFPVDELGLGKVFCVEAARLAFSPALKLAGGNIERECICRGAGGSERKSEVMVILVPF